MQFLGLSILFAFAAAGDDSDEICERGALLEATRCTVSGDPHFTMFNKAAHDMQGEDQYYYVKKCCDVDTDDMPFAILGKHHRVRHRAAPVSTLDYITLELTDDKDVYYVHISRDIYCYYNEDDAVSDANVTRYDDNAAVCEDMTDGSLYLIGDLFKLRRVTRDSGVMAIALTIDDDYKVTMRMTPSKNALLVDEKRLRGHALVIDPFEEYKCYTCGLCGNFRNALPSFETCDGGNVTVIKGAQPTNAFAYDITGNTYSVDYCDADTECAIKKKKYKCNKGDKEIPEFCKAKMWRAANKKCKSAISDVWECCATLDDDGGCQLAISECTEDACAEAEDEDDLNVMVANALYDDATALCQGMEEEDLLDEDEEVAAVMIKGSLFQEPVTPVVNYVIAAAAVAVFMFAIAFVCYKQSSDYKVLL